MSDYSKRLISPLLSMRLIKAEEEVLDQVLPHLVEAHNLLLARYEFVERRKG
jgi:hypothetical protein